MKRLSLIAALVLAQATGAFANDETRSSGISVCNETQSEKLYIAIVTARESDWIAEGWWSAERGACAYVSNRDTVGNAFLYIEDTESREWKGDYPLCVHPNKAFGIAISDFALGEAYFETPTCPDGQVVKGFIRIPTNPDTYEVITVDGNPGYYMDEEAAFEMMFQ
ncbi:MAG: DUF1036 domain-containing protein [Pseudomonadota bacterium]